MCESVINQYDYTCLYFQENINLLKILYAMKVLLSILLIVSFASCKKCYDCTKKCGVCQNGPVVVAGCTGDEALNGFSVDSWKVLLESQGYSCQYDNVEEEACGKDEKENKEEAYFECVSN